MNEEIDILYIYIKYLYIYIGSLTQTNTHKQTKKLLSSFLLAYLSLQSDDTSKVLIIDIKRRRQAARPHCDSINLV